MKKCTLLDCRLSKQLFTFNITTMTTMTDRLGISDQIHVLKLGRSFTSKDEINSFNTIRYDFKPASVDQSKSALLDIQENNKVTVTAPNVEGSGTSETVYKGSRRPHQKECVLIIDHETGEITLEKLSQNIVVKRTRSTSQTNLSKAQKSKVVVTPPTMTTAIDSKKSVPLSLPPQSQLQLQHKSNGSPAATNRQNSPNIHKLSSKANEHNQHRSPGQPFCPSMPTLSALSMPAMQSTSASVVKQNLGLSDSSSDSSESSSSDTTSSSSDADSSDDEQHIQQHHPQHPINSTVKPNIAESSDSDSDSAAKVKLFENSRQNHLNSNGNDATICALPSMPKFSQLSEDLRLSESGSDSDG